PSRPGDIPGPRFAWSELPRSAMVALSVAGVFVLGGLVWFILSPPRPDPVLPLFGYVDRPAPTPPPTTAPPKPAATPQPTPDPAVAEPAPDPQPAPTDPAPQQ
ncbi:MAG TPA: hypothetical protein VF310_08455, partial [Vicinamibacteria bacterium]